MNELPTSPNDFPHELHGDENWLRNTIVSLDTFTCVDIHWEMDVRATNATGEATGEWEVTIESGRKQIRSRHYDILNALWYAVELANSHESERWQKLDETRKNALSKLSDDEKRALNLRD